MDGYEGHHLLASMHEERGEVYAGQGDSSFISSFKKALELRKSQMGSLNVFNAVTYCNLSKYLMVVDDL